MATESLCLDPRLVDLLDEQFEYLVQHHGRCAEGIICRDCARFEALRMVLLTPFE